jgi:hypothetical protein
MESQFGHSTRYKQVTRLGREAFMHRIRIKCTELTLPAPFVSRLIFITAFPYELCDPRHMVMTDVIPDM